MTGVIIRLESWIRLTKDFKGLKKGAEGIVRYVGKGNAMVEFFPEGKGTMREMDLSALLDYSIKRRKPKSKGAG